jgi:hypothetical protein
MGVPRPSISRTGRRAAQEGGSQRGSLVLSVQGLPHASAADLGAEAEGVRLRPMDRFVLAARLKPDARQQAQTLLAERSVLSRTARQMPSVLVTGASLDRA